MIDRTTIAAGKPVVAVSSQAEPSSPSSDHNPPPVATENSLLLRCGCGKKLRVKRALIGKSIRCPKCASALEVHVSETARPTSTVHSPRATCKSDSPVATWPVQPSEASLEVTSSTSGLAQLPDTDQPELLAEAIRQA